MTDGRWTKALVIGSRGNIGRPLVRHLKGVGYKGLETPPCIRS
jgi:nucleoside-diphosphate-sugar epimerase